MFRSGISIGYDSTASNLSQHKEIRLNRYFVIFQIFQIFKPSQIQPKTPRASQGSCHGPCLVMFFPKNNHQTALTESPMMATSPLFSATFTTGHPRRTYIGALSGYFLYSDTTNKSTFLSSPLPTSTMRYSTTAQPEPHHAPHTFHVTGQSYHTHQFSRS